ncbi:non-homologous end-joining DNA ligase, partial [Candidatus Parcubacteria bacterium]|nr:non-homologous end-joining DNA ligase [Candidatus Parcubacteria bacterium]
MIKPMLAKLAEAPFDNPNWIFEIKWDGYRTIAEVEKKGKVRLYSRNGLSFNEQFSSVAEELATWKEDAILDGEMVVVDEHGKSHFQLMQNYQTTKEGNLVYYIFDLIRYKDQDLRKVPLMDRKKLLKEILPASKQIRFSDHIIGEGVKFFKEAQKNELEGIVAKDSESPYRAGKRSNEWLKIKTQMRQEAVITGFTEPKGGRKYFGALVLGVYDKDGKLIYIG